MNEKWAFTGSMILFTLLTGVFHAYFFPEVFHDIDEATYAYDGQRILEGKIPFVDFFENKPIGIYYTYALGLALTPHSMDGVRFLSYLAQGFLLALVFHWSRKRFHSTRTGVFAALGVFLLFLHPALEGEAALTEVFALPFLATALFSLESLTQSPNKRIRALAMVAGGIAISFSFLSIIPLAGAILLFVKKGKEKAILGLGMLIIPFSWLFYWIIAFGVEPIYYAFVTLSHRLIEFNMTEVGEIAWLPLILFFLVPFILLATASMAFGERKEKTNSAIVFLGVWIILGILSIGIVQRFYPHHFMILSIPLGILAGIGIEKILFSPPPRHSMAFRAVGWGLLSMMILSTLFGALHFTWSPYNTDAERMGNTIQGLTEEGDFIYVWGYRTEIYWFAQRHAPTPFVHTLIMGFDSTAPFPADEIARMKRDFTRNPPRVMAVINPEFLTNPSTASFFEGYSPHPEYYQLYVKE
ncbi:MAG: glycosyltransferase family 39 protein [archaeon]